MSRALNNRSLKPQILSLRQQGKTYNEIAQILDCSKSIISYHCGNGNERRRLSLYKKNKNTLNKCIMSKFNSFKSRHLTKSIKNKTSGFKRHAKSQVNNIQDGNYTTQDVLDKIGPNPVCYLTGKSIDLCDTKSYNFDHIIPVALGGTNDLSNLGLCIKEANMAKNELSLEDFYLLCESILSYRDSQKQRHLSSVGRATHL